MEFMISLDLCNCGIPFLGAGTFRLTDWNWRQSLLPVTSMPSWNQKPLHSPFNKATSRPFTHDPYAEFLWETFARRYIATSKKLLKPTEKMLPEMFIHEVTAKLQHQEELSNSASRGPRGQSQRGTQRDWARRGFGKKPSYDGFPTSSRDRDDDPRRVDPAGRGSGYRVGRIVGSFVKY
ncbi:hypothetical protein V8E54_002053 [Elaphomyces granulatus]|jgi:hypothetical protein